MRPGSSKAFTPSSITPIVYALPDGNWLSFRKILSIRDEKIKFFVKNLGLLLPDADSFAYCGPDLKLSNYDKNKIHRSEPRLRLQNRLCQPGLPGTSHALPQ